MLLLLAGCTRKPSPGLAQTGTPTVDPKAPAASGYAALPLPDQPAPLTERPPHGLYAASPSPDTLASLSTGILSPDGRYRAAVTPEGAWVARVDGAWLWQIQIPAPPAPPTTLPPGSSAPPATPATPATPPAPPAPPPTVQGALQWSPRTTLLFLDSNGQWQEANPATTLVATLPAALQGSVGLTYSPDGRQVLYYKGTALYTAQRDGTGSRLVGEGLTGYWTPDSTLVSTKAAPPGTQPLQGQVQTPE